MKTYKIRFYSWACNYELTEFIVRRAKCDANILRIIATKMQYKEIEDVRFINHSDACHVSVYYW